MDCHCLEGEGPSCGDTGTLPHRMIGDATNTITSWVYCTLPLGHDGDHVYCGGGAYEKHDRPELHGMFRWPKD